MYTLILELGVIYGTCQIKCFIFYIKYQIVVNLENATNSGQQFQNGKQNVLGVCGSNFSDGSRNIRAWRLRKWIRRRKWTGGVQWTKRENTWVPIPVYFENKIYPMDEAEAEGDQSWALHLLPCP